MKANQYILKQTKVIDIVLNSLYPHKTIKRTVYCDIRLILSEDKSIRFDRDLKYPKLDVHQACEKECLEFTGNSFYLN